MKKKTTQIEDVAVSKIKFFADNPKKFTSKQYKRLLDSIKDIGIQEAVLVNKRTMTVLNGNQRLKASMQLGFKTIPVLFTDIEPEDEARYLVHLNKTLADQDDDGFRALIAKYPDDLFLKALLADYDAGLKKLNQSSSAEFDIVKEVDESYEYLMFITKKSVDYLNVETFFNMSKVYDQHKQKLIGQGRVLDAQLLTRLISFAVSHGVKNVKDLD